MKDRSNCDFAVNVENNIDVNGALAIMVGPPETELGVNAQNAVYIVSPKRNEFHYAGSMPVGAERTAKGQFMYLEQQGGGRYLSFYFIANNRVTLAKKSKALLIDGSYCLELRTLINLNDRISGVGCKNKIRATVKTPICISIENQRSKIVSLDNCSELRN